MLSRAVAKRIDGERIHKDGDVSKHDGDGMTACQIPETLHFIHLHKPHFGQCREGTNFRNRHLGIVLMMEIVGSLPDARRCKDEDAEYCEDNICKD